MVSGTDRRRCVFFIYFYFFFRVFSSMVMSSEREQSRGFVSYLVSCWVREGKGDYTATCYRVEQHRNVWAVCKIDRK